MSVYRRDLLTHVWHLVRPMPLEAPCSSATHFTPTETVSWRLPPTIGYETIAISAALAARNKASTTSGELDYNDLAIEAHVAVIDDLGALRGPPALVPGVRPPISSVPALQRTSERCLSELRKPPTTQDTVVVLGSCGRCPEPDTESPARIS